MDRKVYDVLGDDVVETMWYIVSLPTLGLFICRDGVVHRLYTHCGNVSGIPLLW